MSSELPSQVEDIISSLKLNNDLFKWGVFTRPKAKNLYANNITFLGDAAHPIVPFIGQGGCLALEDAYTFGELVSKFKNDFDRIQPCYQNLRLKRVNRIQRASEIQGRLNHISNPVITFFRNWIMKYTPIIQYRLMWIWSYDLEKEIKKTN
jgi:salicylate hydroxylase